jgi:predicted PurR-regulated permease PerM
VEARQSPSGVDLRGISPRAVVVVCATAGALVAAGFLLWEAPVAILLTLLATLLAVALDHPVGWLVGRHVRHGLAVAAVALVGVLILLGIGFLLVPPAVAQIQQLVHSAPRLLDRLTHWSLYERIDRWVDIGSAISRLQARIAAQPTQLAERALNVATQTMAAVIGGLTVLFLTLFMLLYGRSLLEGALGLVSPARRARVADALGNIYHVLGGYVLGLMAVCAINATATSLLLLILGVPFFLPLGVLSGFSSVIPVVGATLAGIIITLTTWASRGPWYALTVAIFFIVYQQIENHIIGPLVYKRAIRLNPLASMLAFLFAAELWGIAGAVLAVPVLATAQVMVGELRGARRRRALVDWQEK